MIQEHYQKKQTGQFYCMSLWAVCGREVWRESNAGSSLAEWWGGESVSVTMYYGIEFVSHSLGKFGNYLSRKMLVN